MQHRPRLNEEEYNVIKAYREGLVKYSPPKEVVNKPKILIYDLETAPLKSFVWGLWKQNVNIDFIESDWFCLSWAAKWLNDDDVFSDVLTGEEAVSENDSRIIGSLWKYIDEADVVIAHNAKKFDVKRMNTRFLLNGYPPPSFYEVIDTLSVVKNKFSMSSNRLDYINSLLGIERKTPTGAYLWVSCLKGDEEALEKMVEYNENDVIILEQTYLKLRGWITNHPNINVFDDLEVERCSNCGSESIVWDGYKTTSAGRYKAYRCSSCGHNGHSRYSDMSTEKKKTVVR